MTIPSSGFLYTTARKYLGVDLQTEQGGKLYAEFLTTLPKEMVVDPNDPHIQELYVEFLSGQLSTVRKSEQVNALSPQEIEAREIVWTIFDLLLTLLKDVSKNQILSSDTLQYLVNYEKKYADLMSRAYFYIGTGEVNPELIDDMYGLPLLDPDNDDSRTLESNIDARQTEVTPSLIPSEYKLGYGGVTLAEVFDWLYEGVADAEDGTTKEFMLNSATWQERESRDDPTTYKQNVCLIQLTKDADGEFSISTQFTRRNLSEAEIRAIDDDDFNPYDHISELPNPYWQTGYSISSNSTSISAEKNDTLTALNSTFQEAYEEAKEDGTIEVSNSDLSPWELDQSPEFINWSKQLRDVKIPWNSGILAGGFTNLDDASDTEKQTLNSLRQKRDAINQKMNAYIDGLTSKIDLIRDRADQQREIVDTANTSRKMTSEIIQTAIRQLQNMLASIFK